MLYTLRFNCRRCVLGRQTRPPPVDSDTNSDLSQWNHNSADKKGIEDSILKKTWTGDCISFVFHHKSHDKKIVTV